MELRRQGIINSSPHLVSLSDSGILSFDTDMKSKVKECTVHFSPVQAAGTPAPDNVLPISGWTGVTGYRAGANILKLSNDTLVYVRVPSAMTITYQDNNSATLVSTYAYANYVVWELFKVTPSMVGGSIYCSNLPLATTYIVTSADNWSTWGEGVGSNPYTFKDEDVGKAVGFLTYTYGQQTATIANASVNFGTTPTTYSPYSGTTYPVDWTDVAGTIYGGYVDLVRGEVVAEWGETIFDGTENWNVYNNGPTTNLCYYRGTSGKKQGIANLKCNKLDLYTDNLWDSTAYYKISGHPTTTNIYITAGSELSGGVTEFKQWLSENPVTVAYELATPITYQLTPQTVAMLKGTNNVWSNTNGAIDLSFWAHKEP